ncbi:MAG: metallophosphoesterase [Pseudomonadota bacterium]
MDHAGGHPASPFAFAFLSDPHLPLPDGPVTGLRLKQRLGQGSWRRKRQYRHRPEVLAALLDDMRAMGPDHIVLGGDLVNIALPEEFARARNWLAALGSPDDVTLVPGNHDAYVPSDGLDLWRPWMTGDDGTTAFPYRRDRGPVSFVCLSTAVPKPPLLATGTLGAEQVARAEDLLRAARDRVRVVVLHHPPDGSAPRRKALTDRAALQAMLARTGADLVLHGHLHHARMGSLPGPDGPIPVIGVPSASMAVDTDKGDPARWLHVAVRDGALTVTARGLGPDGFATLSRLTFSTAS